MEDEYMLTLQHEMESLRKKIKIGNSNFNSSETYSGPVQISLTVKTPISKYSFSEAETVDFDPVVIQTKTVFVKSDFSHQEGLQSKSKSTVFVSDFG
jgi:hypothetical protein